MGLSIQQQLLINRSIRNGEGGIDQMKRANSLISEMKTTIPDFSEHSAVYTQLARYLAKDEDCSTEDIINAYNSIKDSLKSNGRESNDKDVLTVFNLFKIMVNDVQIHPLYNNADLEAGDITKILCSLASGSYKKSEVMEFLLETYKSPLDEMRDRPGIGRFQNETDNEPPIADNNDNDNSKPAVLVRDLERMSENIKLTFKMFNSKS